MVTRSKISLSQVVSRVFDPVTEIPLAIGFAVWFAVAHDLRWRFLVMLLLIDAFLPFLFFIHLLRKGEVSNWDLRERKERMPLYLFTVITHLIGVLMAWLLGKTELFVILISFYLVAVVFMAITSFWKISVHGGVNALLITFLNVLAGWKYWWLYGIVLLVGWARIKDKHHTFAQYIIGSLVGGILFLVSFSLFSKLLL